MCGTQVVNEINQLQKLTFALLPKNARLVAASQHVRGPVIQIPYCNTIYLLHRLSLRKLLILFTYGGFRFV